MAQRGGTDGTPGTTTNGGNNPGTTPTRGIIEADIYKVVGNTLFVLPYELGAKEGSLYFLFPLVGVDPALGVYAALVSRVRDLAGIAAGLGLIWGTGRRRGAAPAPASTEAT